MELFDKLSTIGKEVGEKAKDISSVASLKVKVAGQEDIIKKNYIELGKKYYELYGSEPEEGMEEACKAIAEAQGVIEDLEGQIKAVRGL